MIQSSYEKILAAQQNLAKQASGKKAFKNVMKLLHSPDMLVVGCIDARLPIATMTSENRPFIHRVPAAFIKDEESIRSSIEVALNNGVTDFVVMGHTDCKAIGACLHRYENYPDTITYLSPLNENRAHIIGRHGLTEKSARLLEEEGVRHSLATMLEISPRLAQAVAEGKVRVHGWILNIEKALSEPPQPFIDELAIGTNVMKESIARAKFMPLAGHSKTQGVAF